MEIQQGRDSACEAILRELLGGRVLVHGSIGHSLLVSLGLNPGNLLTRLGNSVLDRRNLLRGAVGSRLELDQLCLVLGDLV